MTYSILNDAKRNRNYNNTNGRASPDTDGKIVEGDWKGAAASWYRFQEPAGTQMADSSPYTFSCGTYAPGWLNGTHPAVVGQNVTQQVCFNGSGNSCYYNIDVEIKNCGGYYLYKLKGVPDSSLKYCGQ